MNAERVAVEWEFALAKSYGLGLTTSKLDQTIRIFMVLSVMAMNVDLYNFYLQTSSISRF